RKERKAARAAARQEDAVAPAASAPSLGQGPRRETRPAPASRGGDDDFSDIEAILKKHGIWAPASPPRAGREAETSQGGASRPEAITTRSVDHVIGGPAFTR